MKIIDFLVFTENIAPLEVEPLVAAKVSAIVDEIPLKKKRGRPLKEQATEPNKLKKQKLPKTGKTIPYCVRSLHSAYASCVYIKKTFKKTFHLLILHDCYFLLLFRRRCPSIRRRKFARKTARRRRRRRNRQKKTRKAAQRSQRATARIDRNR